MTTQLSLAVSLREEATFANFLAREPVRAQALQFLSEWPDSEVNLVYLWGAPASGVSHLAQAVCHLSEARERHSQYLPLRHLSEVDAGPLLEGLEHRALVCLEDVQCIAGREEWERAFFNLYNKLGQAGHLLVVTADSSPAALPLALPDLKSRLSHGLVFHLPPYSDQQKQEILQFRSTRMGLEMNDEVAVFLMSRYSRDLGSLMALLAKLDTASLESKRRLTIPFIKQVLNL